MTAPIYFSWKIESERQQRDGAAHAARIADAKKRVAALVAPSQSPTQPTLRGGAAVSANVEESMFVRIDWKLKLKEKLCPWLRDKRLAREAALAAAVPETPVQPAEEPVEPAFLPGARLQNLKEQDEESVPPLPVDEMDVNMTRGDYDDLISALPPMPGHQRQVSAVSSVDFDFLIDQQRNDDPSLEDLMDDALHAADAPGNRCSVRSPLPAAWRTAEFSRMISSSHLTQQETSRSAELLPLPSAVFESGPGHLPALSSSRSVPNYAVTSSRPGTAGVDTEIGEDGAQATPASGRWFCSARRMWKTNILWEARRPRKMESGDCEVRSITMKVGLLSLRIMGGEASLLRSA